MNYHADKISEAVIRRLTDYLRCLRCAAGEGKEMMTSRDISLHCGLKPSIIRKDLAQFGAYGIKGRGYDVKELKRHLKKILGLDHLKNIILIGVGHLGTAILRYPGFLDANFNFIAAFDNDPGKIGTSVGQTPVFSVTEINTYVKEQGIEIVVLAVPSAAADSIVDGLDPSCIKGILNFTSRIFPGRKNEMYIHNIDLAKELEVISFCMKNCLTADVNDHSISINNERI